MIIGSTAHVMYYLDNDVVAIMATPVHYVCSYSLCNQQYLTKSQFINNTRIQIEKDVDYIITSSVKLLNLT